VATHSQKEERGFGALLDGGEQEWEKRSAIDRPYWAGPLTLSGTYNFVFFPNSHVLYKLFTDD